MAIDYSESIKNPGSIDDALAFERAKEAANPALAAERQASRENPIRIAQAAKQVDVAVEVATILQEEDGIHTLIQGSSGNLVFCTPEGQGFRETPWSSFGLNLYTVEEWVQGIRKSYQHYLSTK